MAEPDERQNLGAAQAGDEAAFGRLVEPYRRELHLHCYRLLGPFYDADDAIRFLTSLPTMVER